MAHLGDITNRQLEYGSLHCRSDATHYNVLKLTRLIHSMASAVPNTDFHPETAFLTQQKARNISKYDARTTLWNTLDTRSIEWHDRGIIPNEHLASGTDEPWSPWSTWRSLNGLRVEKGRCRAMMKMWKLSHTYVCDNGERQTMSHLTTCGDAPNCTWTGLAITTVAGVSCAKHWEESI